MGKATELEYGPSLCWRRKSRICGKAEANNLLINRPARNWGTHSGSHTSWQVIVFKNWQYSFIRCHQAHLDHDTGLYGATRGELVCRGRQEPTSRWNGSWILEWPFRWWKNHNFATIEYLEPGRSLGLNQCGGQSKINNGSFAWHGPEEQILVENDSSVVGLGS